MSLSQKHEGLVLVPWFNLAEWQHVKKLIYSQSEQDRLTALAILKVWKQRTPLLSAGVEGTLIVLEALMVNTSRFSQSESSSIFCTSLMRFLNLCAASGGRQGTFYKKAKENQLPKWLVGIRHDIAHSHLVPSKSKLEFSLKFCLNWLKEKYWDVQEEFMDDFVVGKVQSVVPNIVSAHERGDFEYYQESCVEHTLIKILKKEVKDRRETSAKKFCQMLVFDEKMLEGVCEVDDRGDKVLADSFIQTWQYILDILFECKIMTDLLLALHEFTCDPKRSFSHREVASLWLKNIFQTLKEKEESNEVFNQQLENTSFIDRVLEEPSPFTMNFVKEVLEYNGEPPQFIQDVDSIISAFNTKSTSRSTELFTVDDLGISLNEPKDSIERQYNSSMVEVEPTSQWEVIQDVSPYMNLPLGILPHMDVTVSPMLISDEKS